MSSSKNRLLARDWTFKIGQYFRHGKTVFRLHAPHQSGWIIEHTVTHDRRYIEESSLINDFLGNTLIPCTEVEANRAIAGDAFIEDDKSVIISGSLMALSQASQDSGNRAIKYIRALRDLGYSSLRPTTLLELDYIRLKAKFADHDVPKLSTLYSIARRIDRNGGDLRAAYPNFADRGGRGRTRIDTSVIEELRRIVTTLNPHKPIRYSVIEQNLHNSLSKLYGFENAVDLLPSRTTTTRVVKDTLGAYEIHRRNHGQKSADKHYRDWYPRDRATSPLETVEFDDKDTRVFGIDDLTGLPAGRIYLTAGVDQHSTVPLGISISHLPRDTWSAIHAFKNCVLPKSKTSPDFEKVQSDVPFFGVMGIAIFDNALYNHSKLLNTVVTEISNAMIAWAKPYTPTEKSVVEDFNGQMVTGFLETIPGFAGKKDSRDRINEGLLAANLGTHQFRQCFMKWAYDVYCNTPRSGGQTPRQRWEEGLKWHKPRIPTDINRINFSCMERHTLRLRPDHILFTGLSYHSPRIQLLRRRLGHNAQIEIRYQRQDISHVFAHDPVVNEWFRVPSTNPEYTQHLTLMQHKLIRKKALELRLKNPSIPQLLEQRDQLRILVEQSRWSPKLRERKMANKVGTIFSTSLIEKPPVSEWITDLESQVMDLDDVEMEIGDDNWDFPESI